MATIIKAIKGNKSYTVNSEQDKNAYKAQGFDIYEGDVLVENGVGKSVSLEAYDALKSENVTLKEENEAIQAENDSLKKENSKLKKENEKLKGDDGKNAKD